MSITTKAVGVTAAGAAAVALGLGVSGAARADTATPSPSPTSTQSSQSTQATGDAAPSAADDRGRGHGKHGGLGRGADLSALASKLGVDQTKLEAAVRAVRDEMRPAAGSTPDQNAKPDPSARKSEFAAKLASKLGIDAGRVEAALTAMRAAHEAEHEKAFTDRLAKAVTDGTLTRAEADAVKKAAKAGVIGMRGGGPAPR